MERPTEGVQGGTFRWAKPYYLARINSRGGYSFPLQNQLRESVGDIRCLVIFCGSDKPPVEVDSVSYPGVIPAGLAEQADSSSVAV